MNKQNPIDPLQQFVWKSNTLVNVLHGLAMLGDITKFGEAVRVLQLWELLTAWDKSLDAAYAAADGDGETRTVLAVIGQLFGTGWTEPTLIPSLHGLILGNAKGIFLRKFEGKMLRVEERLAALAVENQKGTGKGVPKMGILPPSLRDEDAMRQIRHAFQTAPGKRLHFADIVRNSDCSESIVRDRLTKMMATGEVKKVGKRGGYQLVNRT